MICLLSLDITYQGLETGGEPGQHKRVKTMALRERTTKKRLD